MWPAARTSRRWPTARVCGKLRWPVPRPVAEHPAPALPGGAGRNPAAVDPYGAPAHDPAHPRGEELPAGTPLELTESTAAGLAGFLARQPEVASVYTQVGVTERALASLKEYSAANTARLRVMLVPSRHGRRDLEELRIRLQPRLDALAGATYAYSEEGVGLREVMASGESAFTLGVVAEDPAEAVAVAMSLLPRLRQVPGLGSVDMERVMGNPTVEITIDREKALRYGLEPDALARELRDRIQGTVATTYNEIEQRIDIAVRLPREQRHDLALVLGSPVRLPDRKTVPLSAFVSDTEGVPVREIVRRDQRRQVTIGGDVEGRSVDEAWSAVKPPLAALEVPDGVSFVTGGEQEEINSSFRSLGWALLLSCMLVYMILAAQFESLQVRELAGAAGPAADGEGALLPAGRRTGGFDLWRLPAPLRQDLLRRAVCDGVRIQLRSTLLTSGTTIAGLLPLLCKHDTGGGRDIWENLALSSIGGLTSSTVLILGAVPALYWTFTRWGWGLARLRQRWSARRAVAAAAPDGALPVTGDG